MCWRRGQTFWRLMKKQFEKTGGHDSKTEDQNRIKQNLFHRGLVHGEALFARILQFSMLPGDARPEAYLKQFEKNGNRVLSFSPNPTKRPARKKRKTGRPGVTAPRFWRLSLSDLLCLVKVMFAHATSKRVGSETRGEGRERGNLIDLIETTSKPPGSPEGWWDLTPEVSWGPNTHWAKGPANSAPAASSSRCL